MMLSELNEKAWRISVYAMLKKGKKWEACTKGKIREIYEKVHGGGNFMNGIIRIMEEYSLPEDKKENERVFKAFGAKLVKELEGLGKEEAKQLVEYVLWDISELESLFNMEGGKEELEKRLKLRLRAELVKDMRIGNDIIEYWSKKYEKGRKGKRR